ncbi:MtrAB system histidine kinase MtrB [Corynebacterium sp.]|uniref:MtrAB system histidine kinase MtrB n=1 Tax=Corynebacterium sp. TaxID=1720 RepID=UPI0037359E9F
MQVRFIGSVMIASGAVMLLLAFALSTVVTQRLVDTKIDVADSQIDRARATVEQQINATGSSSSMQVRLNSARASLSSQNQNTAETPAVFEPVLIVEGVGGEVTASPEGYRIPENLRNFVSQGQVSYQFAPLERADGTAFNALIIGTPTEADIQNLQVYLVMSMESEESTMALMRGLLATAALVVIVLLVGIAWLATQQITGPIRSASRIAERLASGHLRERMAVEGEDEMARLALSFNNMADKLSSQIHQLEEYGDLQRQFTSDVSHELRTPLTTVRMAADMIAAEEDSLEPHTKRASQLMIRELDRFEALLGDLLEISRHDAGVADLAVSTIKAQAPLESAWQQTKHLAAELDVDVTFDVPEEPVTMEGDTRRIERILRNLLANALDHSDGNPVNVRLAENEDAVAYTVTDHGVGLKPGQEELVFNRFWRADASRKRHSGGTGLGLAIAREDAVLHKGILDAGGTAGVGSQFRLVLPKKSDVGFAEAPLPLSPPVGPTLEATP